mmetsp:Transcript_3479/g.5212  ORF Transcript_3479/g.5212 Transcript_3479/m.5212 type:complete len:85 (+) Transcript_3479:1035-1289(+)
MEPAATSKEKKEHDDGSTSNRIVFCGITFIHHPQWEATKSESTNYDTEEAQKEAQPYLQPNEDSASNTARSKFSRGNRTCSRLL